MSHFTVLVITEAKPGADDLAAALQPWHEFECTGTDDQYVVDVDETAAMRSEYEAATVAKLRDPEGQLHDRFDDRFYRDPTEAEIAAGGRFGFLGSGCTAAGLSYTSKDWGDGRGHRARVHQVPEGFVEMKVPAKDQETFADWAADYTGREVVPHGSAAKNGKHGYILLAPDGDVEKVVDRTNPNKKWDWWKIGGRWTGFFKLRPGADGIVGSPGALTEAAAPGHVDIARIADVDFDAMREEEGEKAAARYDRFRDIVGKDATWKTWACVRSEYGADINGARDAYNAQDAIRRVRSSGSYFEDEDEFIVSRDAYIEDARDGAAATFAVVKDGQWHERGSMGWWGCVHNEQPGDVWNQKFAELIDGLPPTAWLSVVDCHI